MANSFLGFPVPRAKIADMITQAAPPLAHHDRHEKDGDDEIDCTGLTGAGGGGLPYSDIVFNEFSMSKDNFYTNLVGSGTVTEDGTGIWVKPGTTISSIAEFYKAITSKSPVLSWDKKFQLIMNVLFYPFNNGTNEYWATRGRAQTYNHIGFKVVGMILYGTAYDGSESTVALSGGSWPAFTYTSYTLGIVFDPATGAAFYVNGTLRGTLTTHIPTGDTDADNVLWFYAGVTEANKRADLALASYSFWQEA